MSVRLISYWHFFKEFLFCILPMINIPRLRNTLLRLMWKKPDAAQDGKSTLLRCHCGVCGELPTNVHQTICGHIFCYMCIKVCSAPSILAIQSNPMFNPKMRSKKEQLALPHQITLMKTLNRSVKLWIMNAIRSGFLFI